MVSASWVGSSSLLLTALSPILFCLSSPGNVGLSFATFLLFLLQDTSEIALHEGSVSAVELLRPFRGGFLGVLFVSLPGVQSVEHALEA